MFWAVLAPILAVTGMVVLDLLRGPSDTRRLLSRASAEFEKQTWGKEAPPEQEPRASKPDLQPPASSLLPETEHEFLASDASPSHPDEQLLPYLADGVVSKTELSDQGRLGSITAWCLVEAPPDEVWAELTNWEQHPAWMPKCRRTRIVKREGDTIWTEEELESPGPNVRFKQITRVYEQRLVRQYIYEGDLAGGKVTWELISVNGEPRPQADAATPKLQTPAPATRTIVKYWSQVSTKNAGVLFDIVTSTDPSIESAINLSTGVVRLEALKRRVEHAFERRADYQDE